MKRLIRLNGVVDKLKTKEFTTWIDKLTFLRIFLIWTSIVAVFGLLYFFLSTDGSHLLLSQSKEQVSGLLDHVYFSFVTATTTGFGDIIPTGAFKIIAIFEVVFGLMLLAFVTSKLVSIKQDIILNEVYEISFNEKINRVRSSLLLFRQNIGRIIDRVEGNSIRKREVSELYTHISSFEDILNEIKNLVDTPEKHYFKKVVDPLNTELIFNGILQSFERIIELMHVLDRHGLEWRRELTISLINRCIDLNNSLFEKLNHSKNLPDKKISDLNAQKNKVIEMIKIALNQPKHKSVQKRLA